MSVSFYPSIADNVAHVIQCICGQWQYNNGEVFTTRKAANNARKTFEAYKSECTDPYCEYSYVQPLVAEPEVQMSNHNSVALLDALEIQTGEPFEDRCSGQMDAAEFLERVLIARGLHVGVAEPATQQGIVYTPARDTEYVDQRLAQMQHVAFWAIKNNRTITWS